MELLTALMEITAKQDKSALVLAMPKMPAKQNWLRVAGRSLIY